MNHQLPAIVESLFLAFNPHVWCFNLLQNQKDLGDLGLSAQVWTVRALLATGTGQEAGFGSSTRLKKIGTTGTTLETQHTILLRRAENLLVWGVRNGDGRVAGRLGKAGY